MSAHHMVYHFSDPFRGVMGEKALARKEKVFARGFMKRVALSVPVRWPHGLATMLVMDQEIGGTPPGKIESDVGELRLLLERLARDPRDFVRTQHLLILEVSEKERMHCGYDHMDHHFRQFGVCGMESL